MTDKEQIEVLKMLVISLAKAYQQNYNTFAASYNYSTEVKNMVGEDIYERIWKVFSHFSTVQGGSYRDLVEELASLPIPNNKFTIEVIRELFEYDRKTTRETLYKANWSEESKVKQLAKIKKIWMEE